MFCRRGENFNKWLSFPLKEKYVKIHIPRAEVVVVFFFFFLLKKKKKKKKGKPFYGAESTATFLFFFRFCKKTGKILNKGLHETKDGKKGKVFFFL